MTLTIRPEAMETMEKTRRQTADQALAEYAERRFPTVFKPERRERSLEIVHKVRDEASRRGMTREDMVASYLDLVTMYGFEWYRSPWAADVLSSPVLPGPEKMAVVRRRLGKHGVEI